MTLTAALAPALIPATIPSPTQGVWWLGPLPIRAYALCILAGIAVAIWSTGRRLEQRGYAREAAMDIAIWAVPIGILGGRLYHVATSWQPYFGPGGHPENAIKVWEGGLGIWGAVALGAVGVWIGCRKTGVPMRVLADAVAPGLLVAEGIGRFGNYFNNELYGGPTTVPWALEIHAWDQSAGQALRDASGQPIVIGTFHPTFLYEAVWCFLSAALLLWLERRRPGLATGRLFAALLMLYTVERFIVENMRVDDANHILGLRLNVWTSILVFAIGAALWVVWGRRPVRGAGPAPSIDAGWHDGATEITRGVGRESSRGSH